jgi:hypothetical protein
VLYHISLFSGENYEYWCVKKRTWFVSQDLWVLVSVGYTETYNALFIDKKEELKENKRKGFKALFILQTGVETF